MNNCGTGAIVCRFVSTRSFDKLRMTAFCSAPVMPLILARKSCLTQLCANYKRGQITERNIEMSDKETPLEQQP